MTETYCMVLATAGSQEEADQLAQLLVERQLAACVQILPITSWYTWKGKVNHAAECLLLIKTTVQAYARLEAAIIEHHSYQLPEIIQIPIVNGLKGYLDWIGENTRGID